MPTINGPFKFGNSPPKQLMGWDVEQAAEQKQIMFGAIPPFQTPTPTTTTTTQPIWEIVKTINDGKHLPTFKQQIGDCVGAGAKQMLDYLTIAQVGRNFQENFFRPAHCSFIYGMSRVKYLQRSIRSDGSTGRAAALVLQNDGAYFEDWKSSPPYSGALSRKWGEKPGPPEDIRALAEPHLVLSISEVQTVAQLKAALKSGCMCTIASMQGFDMQPLNLQGYHVFKPGESWAHQMCFLEWMEQPFPAAYRMNSWGPDAHGTPLHGEPPGGAWNLQSDLEREFQSPVLECFAFRALRAWLTSPNYNIIYQPDHRQPPIPYQTA